MKIKIATPGILTEVEASFVGRHFCVHKTHYLPEDQPKKDSYTVTLLPVGYSIVSSIPWLATAKELAKELEALIARDVIDREYVTSADPKKATRAFPSEVIEFCKALQQAAWGAKTQKDLDITAIKLQYLGKDSTKKIVQGSLL